MSEHSSDTKFKWNKNGEVQLIESPFKDGKGRSLVREVEENQSGTWIVEGDDEIVNRPRVAGSLGGRDEGATG